MEVVFFQITHPHTRTSKRKKEIYLFWWITFKREETSCPDSSSKLLSMSVGPKLVNMFNFNSPLWLRVMSYDDWLKPELLDQSLW